MIFIVLLSIIQISLSKLWRKIGFFRGEKGFRQRITELNDNITSRLAEEKVYEGIISELGVEGLYIITENPQTGCFKRAVGRYRENAKEQPSWKIISANAGGRIWKPKSWRMIFPRKSLCRLPYTILPAVFSSDTVLPALNLSRPNCLFLLCWRGSWRTRLLCRGLSAGLPRKLMP